MSTDGGPRQDSTATRPAQPAEGWHPLPLRRAPFDQLGDFVGLLSGPDFPPLASLDRELSTRWPPTLGPAPTFVAQTPCLLADGLHYEARIRSHRQIPTRVGNWHDLFGALAWLRFPRLKWALNLWQVQDLMSTGSRQRTRRQQAYTHVDEAGLIVLANDVDLLQAIDAHDWQSLFADAADRFDHDIRVVVFGHALFDLLRSPRQTLAGKAIRILLPPEEDASRVDPVRLDAVLAGAVAGGHAADPKDLPSLPLAGIPGWHPRAGDADFLATAPCFRPRPEGRCYAPVLIVDRAVPSSSDSPP